MDLYGKKPPMRIRHEKCLKAEPIYRTVTNLGVHPAEHAARLQLGLGPLWPLGPWR